MDITRTMPQTERPDYVESFFDGSTSDAGDWPFGRTVRNVNPGDFLYLIYRGLVRGRFLVTEVEQTDRQIPVGTVGHPVVAKTVVWVQYPGERAEQNIERDSHRGHRYDDVPEWA